MLPELDGRTADNRNEQQATITSVLNVLAQRADTLRVAAEGVMAMTPPADTTYTPISAADAVILYAGNFVPSWAGAIAIDLLPMVLVFIVAITQAAIRAGRGRATVQDTLTMSEFRAALSTVREVEQALHRGDPQAPAEAAKFNLTPVKASGDD